MICSICHHMNKPGMKEHRNFHALALFLFWQKIFFVLCSVLRSRAKIFFMLCSVLCSRSNFFSCSVLFYVLRFIFCVLLWSITYGLLQKSWLRNLNIIFLSPHRPAVSTGHRTAGFAVRLFGVFGSNSSRVTRKIYGSGWKYKVLRLKYTAS